MNEMVMPLYSSDKLWLLSRKNGLKCGTPEDLIFNNQLDDLFENNNVSFDKYTGSFKLKRNNEKFIKVTAEEPYLFWVNNLIERLGYTKTTDSDNEPVVCHIIVENAQNIKLISSENVLNFNSFEELRTQLTLL